MIFTVVTAILAPEMTYTPKNIGMNVSVEQIEGNDIRLKYDGGLGTDMIIGGLLSFLSSTPAMKMMEKSPGNGIVVHLNEIEEAQKVLEMVELTDITFNDNAVDIEGKFKEC